MEEERKQGEEEEEEQHSEQFSRQHRISDYICRNDRRRISYDMLTETRSSSLCTTPLTKNHLASSDATRYKRRATVNSIGTVDVKNNIALQTIQSNQHRDNVNVGQKDLNEGVSRSNFTARKLVSQSVQTEDSFPLLCDECSCHINSTSSRNTTPPPPSTPHRTSPPTYPTPPKYPSPTPNPPRITSPALANSKQHRADFVLVNRTSSVTHADSYFRHCFEEKVLEIGGMDLHKIPSSDGTRMYTVVGTSWETLGLAAQECCSSCELNITKKLHPAKRVSLMAASGARATGFMFVCERVYVFDIKHKSLFVCFKFKEQKKILRRLRNDIVSKIFSDF